MLKEALKEKRFEDALREAQERLVNDPRNVALLSIAASASFSLSRFEEAREFLERALAVQPQSKALHDNLERVMRRLKK